MHIKNKRGQSTVEYVLLVTAVIAVIIAFTTGTGSNTLKSQLNTTLSTVAGDINADQLTTSHMAQPAPGSNSTKPPYAVIVTNGV